jgi:hypothetical protein
MVGMVLTLYFPPLHLQVAVAAVVKVALAFLVVQAAALDKLQLLQVQGLQIKALQVAMVVAMLILFMVQAAAVVQLNLDRLEAELRLETVETE